MSATQRPSLSPRFIDRDAREIVEVLQRKGHTAYLVGGCVRDLLLGKQPKDYDIATTARPGEVKRAVRNSYIIGKRFRLVLAKRGEDLFEIATFRKDPEDKTEDDPDIEGDNLFGTPEDDANRRDFTINALFYDPVKEQLIDHAGGMADLEAGVVRMIGDPLVRLKEDPIRIMRAVRLAHMIRFQLDPELRKGIVDMGPTLKDSALPRRREEFLKFLRLDDPSLAFLTCEDLGLLEFICPSLLRVLKERQSMKEFYDDLRGFHSCGFQTPGELFAGLVVSYAKLELGLDVESDDLAKYRISEDAKVLPLMKDELGMFKSEQASLEKALRMLPNLRRRKEFERKAERRRFALFRTEAFPLSLKLAEREYLLSPDDIHYWRTEYEKRPVEALEESRLRSKKRRRRRPPRRRRNQDSSKSSGDTQS